MRSTSRPIIRIWNGLNVKTGHLGYVQHDLNILGHVFSGNGPVLLTYSLNEEQPVRLNTRLGRRIAEKGDFNADIPVAHLKPGLNRVVFRASDEFGNTSEQTVAISNETGAYPLPVSFDCAKVKDIADVGVITDGRWQIDAQGISNAQAGYDRVLIFGNRDWRDYEITALMSVNGFSRQQGPDSSEGQSAGFCLRWQGHSREANLPGDQPKWGLHPRGGLVWLTFTEKRLPPVCEFLRGDSEEHSLFGQFPIELGRFFWMKGRCETLPDAPAGEGVTRYSFKVWNEHRPEPQKWTFAATQVSAQALRSGGAAIVAHETFVTLKKIAVTQL